VIGNDIMQSSFKIGTVFAKSAVVVLSVAFETEHDNPNDQSRL
jgi:hypothetical protein